MAPRTRVVDALGLQKKGRAGAHDGMRSDTPVYANTRCGQLNLCGYRERCPFSDALEFRVAIFRRVEGGSSGVRKCSQLKITLIHITE